MNNDVKHRFVSANPLYPRQNLVLTLTLFCHLKTSAISFKNVLKKRIIYVSPDHIFFSMLVETHISLFEAMFHQIFMDFFLHIITIKYYIFSDNF